MKISPINNVKTATNVKRNQPSFGNKKDVVPKSLPLGLGAALVGILIDKPIVGTFGGAILGPLAYPLFDNVDIDKKSDSKSDKK